MLRPTIIAVPGFPDNAILAVNLPLRRAIKRDENVCIESDSDYFHRIIDEHRCVLLQNVTVEVDDNA